MYYVLVSIILFSFIFYFENRRSNSKRLSGSGTFINRFKSNYNGFLFVVIPFFFTLVAFSCFFVLVRFNVMFNNNVIKLFYVPYILYTVITVPIVEEYFYRFLPYEFFGFSKPKSILVLLISSFIFTMFHSLSGVQYIFMFLMAIILSVIYLKTKNITYSVMCHALYNIVMNVFYIFGFNYSYLVLLIFGILGGLFLIFKRKKG